MVGSESFRPASIVVVTIGDADDGARLVSACIRAFEAPVFVEYGADRTYLMEFASTLGVAALTSTRNGVRWRYCLLAEPGPTTTEETWTALRLWVTPSEKCR